MKILYTNFKNGKLELDDVPIPSINENEILIESIYSAISYGTENYLIEFGKSNLIKKVINNKDKIQTVINKIKNEGFNSTYNVINDKFNVPVPLGYSNFGQVIKIGKHIKKFKIGDKVVSNGFHAEYNAVSENLCAKVPNNIDGKDACFAIIGSIALHSIRLSNVTIGENVVVIGLGLIGMAVSQILKASGSNVIAIDIDKNKKNVADLLEIDFLHIKENDNDLINKVINTYKIIDKVIITSSSNDNKSINLASEIIKKKGKIVLVGIANIKLNRDLFYKKEIEFVVSSSYGPGRYNYSYEKKNIDYPISYVRWTAKRNFETIIQLINNNKLNFKKFITLETQIENSDSIYDLLKNNFHIASIITYNKYEKNKNDIIDGDIVSKKTIIKSKNKVKLSFVGTGNFSSKILIPSFSVLNCDFVYALSKNGLSSQRLFKKYPFKYNTTDFNKILKSDETNTVIISSMHSDHGAQVIQALNYGKHVYCEKPLATKQNELDEIDKLIKKNQKILMVGFNRRYSFLTKKIIELLKENSTPKSFTYTINAGKIDESSWLSDTDYSGGRIIGELCHFIDLIKYITKTNIIDYEIINSKTIKYNLIVNIKFECQSIASINYFSNGNNVYPKENLKIFSNNNVLELDNFKKLKGYGFKNFKKINLWKQDKGHDECIKKFIGSVENNLFDYREIENFIQTSKFCINLENDYDN